jgi:hypothetical protein
MVKIYITGCARSGTTLLARMFNAFYDVTVINEEVSVTDFTNPIPDINTKYIVGKRTEYSMFSNILSEPEKERQLELLKDCIIINCVRDGRDVVAGWWSAWQTYNPSVWMHSIKDAKDYSSFIDYTVFYEDLLERPDYIQYQLEELLGLQGKYCFSDYPYYVPSECFVDKGTNHQLRPLEPVRKSKPLKYLDRPNDVEYFNELLKELGYVRD